ncbi:hypothetical protein HELRODRAFT_172681 [Helobdella robusta]|uniref:Uncharacterized protein n=1 Tax=Helobdella robusta TaxID=6412 RepID=T1F5S1_HELRO|nr:hypothetical protein HELRODRAFT_172681 [Helobdella robusta]ESO04321.1 hypothetical protein HELRODRAFT_172681 [Helobdella robusta]
MAKSFPVENLETIVTKVLEKFNDNFLKCLEKVIDKSNENMVKVITLLNNNLDKIETLSNSFVRAVKSMSNALTDSMTQLHATLSTLGNSVSACQQQVTKLNKTPMFKTMTRALWTVEQERKDDEQRSNNVIISGLELEQGGNDKDMVSPICENHLPMKPQIVRTRRIGKSKLCVTLSNSPVAEDLIASSRILLSSPPTKNIYINPDLSKRQAEQAFFKRQKRRLNKTSNLQMISPFVQSNRNGHLRLALANVRSLQKKTNDLSLFLSTYDPDIFFVIETWLTPNDPDNMFLFPCFSFVRRDRG